MAFWTSDLFDPKVNFRFKVLFKDSKGGYEEVWYASKADQPSLTITTAPAKFLRHKFNFPTSYEWNDVEIVLVDPKKPLVTSNLMKQLSNVAFQHNEFRSMSKTRFLNQFNLVKIVSLKSDGKEGDSWTLNGAFPISVSFSSFDYTNENLTEIRIKFKYDFAKFEDEFGVVYDPVGNQIATSQAVAQISSVNQSQIQVTQGITPEPEPQTPQTEVATQPAAEPAPQPTAPAEQPADTEPAASEPPAEAPTSTPPEPEQAPQPTAPAPAERPPEAEPTASQTPVEAPISPEESEDSGPGESDSVPGQPGENGVISTPSAEDSAAQGPATATAQQPVQEQPRAQRDRSRDRPTERGEERWDLDSDGMMTPGEVARRERDDPSFITGRPEQEQTSVPNLEIPNNDAPAEQARRIEEIQEGTDTSTPSQTVVVPQDSQGNMSYDLNNDGVVTESETLRAQQLELASPNGGSRRQRGR